MSAASLIAPRPLCAALRCRNRAHLLVLVSTCDASMYLQNSGAHGTALGEHACRPRWAAIAGRRPTQHPIVLARAADVQKMTGVLFEPFAEV